MYCQISAQYRTKKKHKTGLDEKTSEIYLRKGKNTNRIQLRKLPLIGHMDMGRWSQRPKS